MSVETIKVKNLITFARIVTEHKTANFYLNTPNGKTKVTHEKLCDLKVETVQKMIQDDMIYCDNVFKVKV